MQRLEPYAAEVHRFVARRVANHADAADIAQQSLLLACAKLDTLRGENIPAWLFTIARRQVIDHYRAKSRVEFIEVEQAERTETEPELQTPSDVVRIAWECRARLGGWLDCIDRRLRAEEQVAVLLADGYGYRDKDSAALLEMSLPSFKLLLHGARAHLQEVGGDNCTGLARKTNGNAARHECADGDSRVEAGRAEGGPTRRHATDRVGVICPLGAPKLVALRRSLLDGLRKLLGAFAAFDPLPECLELMEFLDVLSMAI